MPAPPPPYSSGRLTPRKPSLPASFHSSVERLALRAPWAHVVDVVVALAEFGDGVAQRLLLLGLDETHRLLSALLSSGHPHGQYCADLDLLAAADTAVR